MSQKVDRVSVRRLTGQDRHRRLHLSEQVPNPVLGGGLVDGDFVLGPARQFDPVAVSIRPQSRYPSRAPGCQAENGSLSTKLSLASSRESNWFRRFGPAGPEGPS